jgi:hypothetical protein
MFIVPAGHVEIQVLVVDRRGVVEGHERQLVDEPEHVRQLVLHARHYPLLR